jgi:hypothetical protein
MKGIYIESVIDGLSDTDAKVLVVTKYRIDYKLS